MKISKFIIGAAVIRTIFLMILVIPSLVYGQEADSKKNPVNQIINIIADTSWNEIDHLFKALDNTNSPGVSLAITWNHKPIYIKSYGMADIENKIRVNEETSFNLASLTKQFTAYAALILAEQRKLSLDDPITEYLPELSFDNVTIRHLINQTSGIPSEKISTYGSFSSNGKNALLELYGAQTLVNQPGTQWAYNNNNYNLLSIIIERISGKPLPDFLSEEVFTPLGMKQSYFPFGPGATKNNRAYGYVMRDDQFINVDRNDVFMDLVGAGGMYSSISDLQRWDKALYNENYAAKQRQIDGEYLDGGTVSYGAGVNVSHIENVLSLEHGGTSGATSTYMVQYPEYGASIIVLVASNHFHANGGTKRLTQQIRQELFKRFQPAIKLENNKKNWTAWPIEEIKALTGAWFGELNGTLQKVTVAAVDSDKINLSFFDGIGVDLVQVGNNTFSSDIFPDILIHIISDEIRFLDENKVLGSIRKIPLNKPKLKSKWLTGNYTSSALNNSVWSFSMREEDLVVTNPIGRIISLEPIYDNIVGNTKANIYFENTVVSEDKSTWTLLGGQIPKIELHPTSIQQATPLISAALESDGSEAAWKLFDSMRLHNDKFDFSEPALNRLGYSLLQNHPKEALVAFQMMVKLFPKSANAHDSLADGYLANGKKSEAIKAYESILLLEPNNSRAHTMLKELLKSNE